MCVALCLIVWVVGAAVLLVLAAGLCFGVWLVYAVCGGCAVFAWSGWLLDAAGCGGCFALGSVVLVYFFRLLSFEFPVAAG